MVTLTSRMGFDFINFSGKGKTNADLIMSRLKPGEDYSRMEILQLTGLPINIVTSRVNYLVKTGQLENVRHRPCKVTGHLINAVQIKR